MVVFAVETLKDPDVDHWLKLSVKRSKEPSLLKNPFRFRFKRYERKKTYWLVFDVLPLYPNFTVWGWGLAGIIFFVWGLNFWVFAGLALGCGGFFWSTPFYYLMVRLGIRRNGYKGKIKILRLANLVRGVLF